MKPGLILESPLLKLGRSELIATLTILLLRIKYPSFFNNLIREIFEKELPFESQLPVIFSFGLIFGLLINLSVESTEVFIISNFYGRIINKINKKFDINKMINDIRKKIKKKDCSPPLKKYSHYFSYGKEHNFLVFYNLVRTIGNKYSKNCETVLAENSYRISAYYLFYCVVLFGLSIALAIPPNYSDTIRLSFIVSSLGAFFTLYSSYIGFKRLFALMGLALGDLQKSNTIFLRGDL